MQSRRINQHDLSICPVDDSLNSIARGLRLRSHNGNLLSHQPVHQCAFARIRTPHNRHKSSAVSSSSFLFGFAHHLPSRVRHSHALRSNSSLPSLTSAFSRLCALCDSVADSSYPELRTSPGVHRRARQLLNLHAQHFPLIGFQHLKSKSLQIAFLSRSWNFPAHVTQQSRNRGYRFICRFSKVHAQHFFHICDRRATTHHQRSGSFPHHFQFRMRAICSAHAHDFFHQVFHRSDSRDASMFINNSSHGLVFLPHLPQQF